MNEVEVVEICRQSVVVMFKLMAPIMLAGLMVGILISLLQTITQIQETALTFIPKMVVVFGLTILLMPYMLSTLTGFTHSISDRIVQVGLNNTADN